MSDWDSTANVRIFFGFAPNGNMDEASRQFNVDPTGPQAVICLKAWSVLKMSIFRNKV